MPAWQALARTRRPLGRRGNQCKVTVWSHTNGTFCEIVTEAETVRDTSNLYTTGEVTLLFAVPKPSTLLLTLIALGVVGGWRKWKWAA